MNARHDPSATKPASRKLSILLMDANAERRALRKKVLALQGVEVIGAADLTEASSVWHRDRYDMVLIDIRRDHYGCMAWRDEIKKEAPQQFVAFLVGKPGYVALEPSPTSYVAEEQGAQWGESLRRAIRESCESLPQRNSFAEVGWRIAVARKMRASEAASSPSPQAPERCEFSSDQKHDREASSPETVGSTFENFWLDNANSEGDS